MALCESDFLPPDFLLSLAACRPALMLFQNSSKGIAPFDGPVLCGVAGEHKTAVFIFSEPIWPPAPGHGLPIVRPHPIQISLTAHLLLEL